MKQVCQVQQSDHSLQPASHSASSLWRWALPSLTAVSATVIILGLNCPPAQGSEPPELQRVRRTADKPAVVVPVLAQAPATRTISRQGNQVSVNGRTLPIAWAQWQTSAAPSSIRTGISDVGLVRLAGIQLLSSRDVSRQPIDWFLQPAPLPTFLTKQFRYLDITDLAQRATWQVQVSGSTLQVNSPVARVVSVRQGKQPWGDRIVVDLDRPTLWQVEQQQETIITLDAAIDSASIESFKPKPGSLLQALKLEATSTPTQSNKTTLRLSLPAGVQPSLSTLSNPNRLVIDLRSDYMVERDILWAPGLRWQQRILTVGTTQFPVIWLTANLRQPGLQVKPILPNSTGVQGIAPLTQTAQQAQVAAAINGGFFNRNNQLPLGALKQGGRWLSGPILNRGAIGWNDTGEMTFDRLSLQETLTPATGQPVSLTFLNSAYVKAGVARYTPDWGASYTPLTDNEILLTVQNNQVVNQQLGGAAGSSNIPIPLNSYLLAFRSAQSLASSFPPGTNLRLTSVTTPGTFNRYSQITGAGPLLIQNRQIVLNARAEQFSDAFIRETAARSAIGRTAEGNLLIATVHSRLGGGGATLADIAQIMQQLGSTEALNLDGGSSTTLYLGGQVIDRPPRTIARVHNGIGIFIQPTP